MEHSERRKIRNTINKKMAYISSNIDDMIKTERRSSNKSQLIEIKQQQKTWFSTISICLLINVAFLTLAYVGWLNAN